MRDMRETRTMFWMQDMRWQCIERHRLIGSAVRKSESARFTLEKGEKIPSVVAKCELYQVNLGVYHPLYVVYVPRGYLLNPYQM